MKKLLKKKIIVIAFITYLIMIIQGCSDIDDVNNSNINENVSICNEEILDVKSYNPDLIINLPNSKLLDNGFTCTGAAYDSQNKNIWVCNYGKVSPNDSNDINPSLLCQV